MIFESKYLCKVLAQYKSIMIYGTGTYAREIYPHLVANGLKEKIICFMQTKESSDNCIDGIPVFTINELKCDKKDCVVLIAVSKLYVDEINQILTVYQYVNIVSLIDFIVDNELAEKEYLEMNTFEEYCEHIAAWYVKTHRSKQNAIDIVKKLLIRGKYANQKRELNLIVIICGNATTRSNTILAALKKMGYVIVMLYYYENGTTWALKELQSLDIQIYKCQSIDDMFYKALQYYPLVYIFEPRWADCLWAEIMLKNKRCFGKVVISLYDVINDGFFGQSPRRMDAEKYVLEHADGVIWRWFSKNYLEKKGFIFQGRSIQFLDYCRSIDVNWVNDTVAPEVVKLCLVIGVDTALAELRPCKTKYRSAAKIGEILEKIGNRKDCIFHFYAGKLSEERVALCKRYEKKYFNFKFFVNTDRCELVERLKEYDYGCNLYTEGEIPPDDFLIDCSTGSGMKDYVRNTFAEYLNAGLPIIATMPQKYVEYMHSYNVIIEMDISNIDIEYLKKSKCYYKNQVNEARKVFNIDNEIPRLSKFLKEI